MTESRPKRHFFEIIRGFRNAFLVTLRRDGTMHGRPLAVAHIEEDGRAYFATSITSAKVIEILGDDEVLVTFQSETEFASMSGTASIVQDSALIESFWSEAWRPWFPEGRTDPALCLIEVHPREGEYWDNSGPEGLTYMLEVAKAVATQRRARTDETVNASVTLKKD